MPNRVLAAVVARSFVLQAGFNPRSMQGLGLSFALQPALRALYPEGERRTAAARRYLVHFNTHPAFAPAILGGLVRIEEEIATGTSGPDRAEAFRTALASPLAGIGDAFIWTAWRPACSLLAVVTVPLFGLWSVLLFLGLYNAVHLLIRCWLFLIGYRHVEEMLPILARVRFPSATRTLRKVCSVLAGVTAALLVLLPGYEGTSPAFPTSTPLAAGLAAGTAILLGLPLLKRTPPDVLAYAALALGILAGLVFHAG